MLRRGKGSHASVALCSFKKRPLTADNRPPQEPQTCGNAAVGGRRSVGDEQVSVYPLGKLPAADLARLLTQYAPTDPRLIVGGSIGEDAGGTTAGAEGCAGKSGQENRDGVVSTECGSQS